MCDTLKEMHSIDRRGKKRKKRYKLNVNYKDD